MHTKTKVIHFIFQILAYILDYVIFAILAFILDNVKTFNVPRVRISLMVILFGSSASMHSLDFLFLLLLENMRDSIKPLGLDYKRFGVFEI